MGTLITFPMHRIARGARSLPQDTEARIIILPVVRYEYAGPADTAVSPTPGTTAWPLSR